MSDQKNILHDDSNGLDYVVVGDYYLPMMDLPEETRPIGYWGMLRKEYMKNYKSGMLIEAQMQSTEGVTEELKSQNPMEWVRQCNNIRNRVQEIVLSELVYV